MCAADEPGSSDGREVRPDDCRDADEDEGRKDDVEVSPFGIDKFGGVSKLSDNNVADGDNRQNHGNGCHGKPESLCESADGLIMPVTTAVLGNEGSGISDYFEKGTGKYGREHRDGRNCLKRHVGNVSEKDPINELVDGRDESGGHQR